MRSKVVETIRCAGDVRRRARVQQREPVCSFDLAAALGISVFFTDFSGLEGLSISQAPRPTILVNANRPPGRQNFTCAHELGHLMLGHGVSVDELHPGAHARHSREERLADHFAAALLMPKILVLGAFNHRRCRPESASVLEVYSVSRELGVGFTTLVRHARHFLECISPHRSAWLLAFSPKAIRRANYEFDSEGDVLDTRDWLPGSNVQARVGDYIMLPDDWHAQGACLDPVDGANGAYRAVSSGTACIVDQVLRPARSVYVAQAGFTGLAKYRNLEPEDDA